MSAVSGASGAVLSTFLGTSLENLFGRAVAGVGDFDADGVGDFAIGVPNDDQGGVNAGRVLVYRGAVADTCTLETLGVPSVSGPPASLRVLGCHSLVSLVLVDLAPGPTPIPPWGVAQLGFSPALTALNDPAGFLGVPFGSPIDTQGQLVLGPFAMPPGSAGVTLHVQAFNFTPRAPNGVFQRTNGLAVTIVP